MVSIIIGVTAVLGFFALGLGLLGYSAPSASTPAGITGEGRSKGLLQQRRQRKKRLQ